MSFLYTDKLWVRKLLIFILVLHRIFVLELIVDLKARIKSYGVEIL